MGFSASIRKQRPMTMFEPLGMAVDHFRWADARSSGKVETVEIHHLVPGRHKVLNEPLLLVVRGIDLCEGSELRVRSEDQVDCGAGPPDLPGVAVATFVDVLD